MFAFLLFAGFLSSIATPSRAELVPNVRGEIVAALPKGRFLLSYSSFFLGLDRRFDSSGLPKSYGEPLNRALDWKTIIREVPERSEQVAGLLLSQGIDENASAGRFVGNLSGNAQTTAFVAGYGITDSLSAIVIVPVTRFRIKIRKAFQASDDSLRFVERLEASGQGALATEFASALNQGFDRKLARADYALEENVDSDFLGDIRLDVPYLMPRVTDRLAIQCVGTLQLPTARRAPLSHVLPLNGGDGRWSMGGRIVGSYNLDDASPTQAFRLIGMLGAQQPLPGRRALRVPLDADDPLPSDTDPDVRVSGGTLFAASAGALLQWSRTIKTQFTLEHQLQLASGFSGGAFEPDRYSLLSAASQRRLTTVQAALEFNSIAPFLEGGFPIPLALSAGVGFPLSGLNTMGDPLFMVQTNLFF